MSKLKFQVLSLDGGGVKGVFTSAVLASLEDDLGIRIDEHFDLITGTSTGGVIALALGLGMRPHEILNFYVQKAPLIFSRGGVRPFLELFLAKYSASGLEKALKDCFGNQTLGESRKRLVVPAYNLDKEEVNIFKTRHHTRFTRDFKLPAWEIALATSAAPTYFPVCYSQNNERLIDGGVWANNPIMVGIVEAQAVLNIPRENISVLSIGTTDEVSHHSKWMDYGGKIAWASKVAPVLIKAQSQGAIGQAMLMLGADKIERLDPKVPASLFKLDKLSTKSLIGYAAHDSKQFSPTFKDKFMNHIAEEFVPFVEEN